MWDGYGMGWTGGIGMVIFWGLVIAGVVLLARWFSNESRRGAAPLTGGNMAAPERDRALDIARERFARGEITAEEFESVKRGLNP